MAGTSEGSTLPITNFLYLSNTVLGWNKWKSSETSFPATYKITPLPAGWKFKNLVTSYTKPSIAIQQSVSLLCFSTSSNL